MDDRIKAAFDCIRAEESLKHNTMIRLREAMAKKTHRRSVPVSRLAAAFACVLLVVCFGVFANNSYFTDVAWLDLDINPSVGLTINRYGRVIGAEPYNPDGELLLDGLSLQHRPYAEAMQELVNSASRMGYLQNNGLVSVSLSATAGMDDTALLERTQDAVSSALSDASTQADVFLVDEEIRAAAHEHSVSPARYMAILELQEADPAASIEACRNHSLQELKEQTAQHLHRKGNRHQGHHD